METGVGSDSIRRFSPTHLLLCFGQAVVAETATGEHFYQLYAKHRCGCPDHSFPLSTQSILPRAKGVVGGGRVHSGWGIGNWSDCSIRIHQLSWWIIATAIHSMPPSMTTLTYCLWFLFPQIALATPNLFYSILPKADRLLCSIAFAHLPPDFYCFFLQCLFCSNKSECTSTTCLLNQINSSNFITNNLSIIIVLVNFNFNKSCNLSKIVCYFSTMISNKIIIFY